MKTRTIIKTLVVTLLAVALPETLRGEAGHYKFTHLTTMNSGLSYDGVNRIMQDSRGFIWIGTYRGLNRYDGRRFDVFTATDLGLTTDYINCFAEDRDGNIWVGTDNGVSCYNYVLDRFEPLTRASDSGETIRNKVTFITSDGDRQIWMLVNDQGVFSYDTKYSHLHHISYDSLGVSGFRKMLVSSHSGVWLSRYHSSLYHSPSGLRDSGVIDPFPDGGWFVGDEIEGIYEGADGQVYVASTLRGISEIDPVSGSIRGLFRLPEGTVLLDSFFERQRWLWLTTTDGVWRYDLMGTGVRRIERDAADRFSLSGNYVTCAFVDDGGGVWLGTKDCGVNWSGLAQTNFRKHYTASGASLEGCIVSGFAEESPSKVWVTTEQAGLLLWNPETSDVQRVSTPGIPTMAFSPCIDGNYLWFGSLHGLYRLDTRTYTLKSYGVLRKKSGRNDHKVYLVHKTKNGVIYAGTTLGLFEYDRKNDRFEDTETFDGVFVTSMDEDANGNLWISSFASGIYRWNPSNNEILHLSYGDGLPNNKVSSVYVDAGGRVWAIGFSHGFSEYIPETGKFSTYDNSRFPSLPSDVFFRGVEDSSGCLWLASDSGLVQFNPETSGLRLYTEIEGLLDTKLTNSALRLSSGELCFGSNNGFISFSPKRLRTGGHPDIIISRLHVGDAAVTTDDNLDLLDDIRLDHDQNSFGFDFSVPDMSAASSSWLQCRLKGYDSQWRDISVSRSAFWYSVPAGTYTLELRSSVSSSEWHEAHFPLKIVIRPPFWASSWGITLIVLIVLLIVAAVFLAVRHNAERKSRQMEIDYRRSKEEEVFREKINTVSQIVGLPKKDQDFLAEFDGIVRENLSNALLSNEIIAEKMAVSPSTLVRRIRRLLDTSPNNYVRNLRLVVAAEMLREPHGNNISEICYAVGFSNVSYFAKCFREMYGKTPTVFAEDMRGKVSAPAET